MDQAKLQRSLQRLEQFMLISGFVGNGEDEAISAILKERLEHRFRQSPDAKYADIYQSALVDTIVQFLLEPVEDKSTAYALAIRFCSLAAIAEEMK